MVAEIKHFDVALFESNCDVSSALPLAMAIVLRSKLSKRGSSPLSFALELGGAKRLQEILDNIKPNELHLDPGEVGDFPQDDLMAHMQ